MVILSSFTYTKYKYYLCKDISTYTTAAEGLDEEATETLTTRKFIFINFNKLFRYYVVVV